MADSGSGSAGGSDGSGSGSGSSNGSGSSSGSGGNDDGRDADGAVDSVLLLSDAWLSVTSESPSFALWYTHPFDTPVDTPSQHRHFC